MYQPLILKQHSATVLRARKYIEDNFSSITALTEVASVVGENYDSLRAKFRRETGQTLGDYLVDVRIRAAERLLYHTNLHIKEISWSVGIIDESYCCKLFRLRFGKTMVEMRDGHSRSVEAAGAPALAYATY